MRESETTVVRDGVQLRNGVALIGRLVESTAAVARQVVAIRGDRSGALRNSAARARDDGVAGADRCRSDGIVDGGAAAVAGRVEVDRVAAEIDRPAVVVETSA